MAVSRLLVRGRRRALHRRLVRLLQQVIDDDGRTQAMNDSKGTSLPLLVNTKTMGDSLGRILSRASDLLTERS